MARLLCISHMEEYIRVLLEDDVPQAYGISGSGRLNVIVGKPEE